MSKHTSDEAIKSSNVKMLIKKRHKAPIFFYNINSFFSEIFSNKHFLDSILMIIAFIAVNAAFPAYPIVIAVILAFIIFILAQFHPYLGIISLAAFLFPISIIEFPLLAWVLLLLISLTLILGYRHYRVIVLLFILASLPFSALGYMLEIPFLIISPILIGFKRSGMLYAVSFLSIAALSAITGIQNTGFIMYTALPVHSYILSQWSRIAPYFSITSFVRPTIFTFIPLALKSSSVLVSGIVTSSISDMITIIAVGISHQPEYLLELLLFIAIAYGIEKVVISSRSKYKGAKASIIGVGFPAIFVGLSIILSSVKINYIVPFISFLIAPIAFYLMELYNYEISNALNIKKNDIRMKFGEAFEDLSSGSTKETFDDIADYETIKAELRESIISPLEQKGVSKAYNIAPIKGVLLFGPPGSGKTKLMRALSNETHSAFFYIKASNIVSAYPGESEKEIVHVFDVAKKNTPCILFIDEIDTIAASRNDESTDDVHKHLISQLLVEMDGFERLDRVIVVAATNIPDKLDPALLRPGRFDKAIYMHLPDFNGRKEIFSMYLKKLPLAGDINISEISKQTQRYSGADIQNVCATVAQEIASQASKEHRILEIRQEDIMKTLKVIRPSTTFAQLEKYNEFDLDFRRQRGIEPVEEADENVTIDSVIGMSEAKNSIVEAIQIPLMHPDLIKKYDIKSINGILLYGPPGCGKTMLMRAVKEDFKGVTTLELNGADVERQGLEKANTTIKDLFYRALDNTPSIIFIDEIDGLIRSREGSSEYSAQITSQLLQEMDGIRKTTGVVVVAATNRPEDLDTALLRNGRFDKLVYTPPPNLKERASIFKEYLSNTPLSKDVRFSKLAAITRNFTGADIAGICRGVKMKALERDLQTGKQVTITYKDLSNAIINTKPSASEAMLTPYLNFMARYGRT
ncbi:CDC48 family ATPase of the AAA+ class [Candidatus Mancarchaeum acidiphilum]|uniref:CDC48 family ATPase of the AAA+ class n=1 Tax=Candidatus Mancarchaeum acidiphilum TaxID=1920749 RepID=A0A218NNM4_9ARCH|nr:AAA family ATPase [Candidatus Mancarchaeum acidiphilum]ASI14056.1 CDC48 family ATPase of the AAA+ class [Candidatus Mancarchaeum acidiphilum]